MSLISVIIPVYNGASVIGETLRSLGHQSLAHSNFEVIIVDDGSTDGSLELVLNLGLQFPFPVQVLCQENQGPGAARNRGAAAACHSLLLFWDSDMVAGGQVLQCHLDLHVQSDPILVAGARRPWLPAYTSTFAKTISLGHQISDQFSNKELTFQEVFSSNLSVRRECFWQLGGFDEDLWAFEDSDLAYRAQKAGLSLVFSREAIGYHNHPMTLEQACRQQRHYQRYAAAFLRKHPELKGHIRYLADKGPICLGSDPPGLVARKILRQLIAWPGVLKPLQVGVTMLEKYCPSPRVMAFLYWKILASYQLIGFREGLAQQRKGFIL